MPPEEDKDPIFPRIDRLFSSFNTMAQLTKIIILTSLQEEFASRRIIPDLAI